jgi:DNA polymerase-3 subunit epsilon/ATP-dependent DNA helicase DinG
LQRRANETLPPEFSVVFDTNANRMRQAAQQTSIRLEEFFDTMSYFLQQFTSRWSQYTQQIRFVPEVRRQADFEQLEMAWENLNRQLKPIIEGFVKLAGGIADVSESFEIEDGEELRLSLVNLARNLEEVRANLDAMIAEPNDAMIYWAEVFKERLSLHAAPLHIGPLVEKYIFETKETVIMTSATLRTAGNRMDGEATFDYLKERLHAYHAEELAVGSPFDYESNTLLYLPTDMPEPNQPGYQRYVETAIVDVAKVLNGRTMALFTSYKQLAETAEAIEGQLADAGITVLAQLDGSSRQQLLEQFKQEDSRSVLLGTRSFWEGVDVPGEALQAVMLVKFPFDVPSDPIFAARSETFESPFFQYSIPEVVLRFRQGFGRLIRRIDDEGIVVVLDKRIISKRYGQAFLDALPQSVVVRQRIGRLSELTTRWMNRERD